MASSSSAFSISITCPARPHPSPSFFLRSSLPLPQASSRAQPGS
uniref:Uncharacterized protein n=1 Tax=Arundo donax TaxID=35708 RepID=A0A0A8ZZX4_ARUDO